MTPVEGLMDNPAGNPVALKVRVSAVSSSEAVAWRLTESRVVLSWSAMASMLGALFILAKAM